MPSSCITVETMLTDFSKRSSLGTLSEASERGVNSTMVVLVQYNVYTSSFHLISH